MTACSLLGFWPWASISWGEGFGSDFSKTPKPSSLGSCLHEELNSHSVLKTQTLQSWQRARSLLPDSDFALDGPFCALPCFFLIIIFTVSIIYELSIFRHRIIRVIFNTVDQIYKAIFMLTFSNYLQYLFILPPRLKYLLSDHHHNSLPNSHFKNDMTKLEHWSSFKI